MNNTLDYKCPNCNAVLKFSPKFQNWKCEYCRSEFDLKQLNSNKDYNFSKEVKTNQVDVYTCNNCGANIIADSNTSITSCIYCKNTLILKNKLESEFNPHYLIPFKTTKDDAVKAFKKLLKGKWLMPKNFSIKKNVKDILGIYVPFWIYDYESSGVIETECDKVSTWTSGEYRYTKTDKYEITIGGNICFENVIVDCSKKIKKGIISSIEPFDYNELKKFDYSYLSGFLSEKCDIVKEQLTDEANNKVKNSFIEELKKEIKNYDEIKDINNSINLYNSKSSYVLLPIWFLNIKYKDKIYTFAMNGQTGKTTKDDIPIDKKRAIFIWMSLFVIIFTILLLFNILKVIL